jgi:uncharacterized protein (DUF1697 family)
MPRRPITYVALLRGINVGGNTLVNMQELKRCFEALGFASVRTYIASGNVIFQSPSSRARVLETTIERALTESFDHTITVVVKSLEEMRSIVAAIPRRWAAARDERHNVIFLRHTIDSREALKALTARPYVEEFTYHPGVLFWSAKIKDLNISNMLKISRLPIYREMTVRNLNTTRKVCELMEEADA